MQDDGSIVLLEGQGFIFTNFFAVFIKDGLVWITYFGKMNPEPLKHIETIKQFKDLALLLTNKEFVPKEVKYDHNKRNYS